MKNIYLLLLFYFMGIFAVNAQKKDLLKNSIWKVNIVKQSATNQELWDKYDDKFPKTVIFKNGKFFNADSLNSKPFSETKVKKDSLKFTFNTPGPEWKDSLWGAAHLKVMTKDIMTGSYIYSHNSENGQVEMQLIRIWCCGNHNPQHCGDDLTPGCTKIH